MRKRLTQTLLLAVWFAAVATYWNDSVPAAPTMVIRHDQPAVVIGTTDRNELVTAAHADGKYGQYQRRSPLKFRSLADGSVSRTFDWREGSPTPSCWPVDI